MPRYKAWENPRFKEFEYQSWPPEEIPFAYLSNGFTKAEQHGGGTTGI
jgi:hypothetical protein